MSSTSKLGPGVNESNDSQDTLEVLGIGRGIQNDSLDSYELENDNNDDNTDDNNDDNNDDNSIVKQDLNDTHTNCDGGSTDEEEKCCVKCGETPCELIENKDFIMEKAELLMCDNVLCNKERRHCLYKHTIRHIYGYLGRDVRMPLSSCVVKKIQSLFPDDNNQYTGFKPK